MTKATTVGAEGRRTLGVDVLASLADQSSLIVLGSRSVVFVGKRAGLMLFGEDEPTPSVRRATFRDVRAASTKSLDHASSGQKVPVHRSGEKSVVQVRAYTQTIDGREYTVAELTDVFFHLDALNRDQKLGMLNEGGFTDAVARFARRAKTGGQRLIGFVYFIDMDYLNELNETLGHDKVDLILQEVASRIDDVGRAGEHVSGRRNGGDEFLVFCATDDQQRADAVCSRLRTKLGLPYLDGEVVGVSASVGHSKYRVGERYANAVARAEEAMYDYKRNSAHAVRGPSRKPR